MEQMFKVKNVTNHNVHLAYPNEKGMPVHITLEPGGVGEIPRDQMLIAVLNPFIDHKGEIVPANDECQAEVNKTLPAVRVIATSIESSIRPGNKGNKPGRDI